MTAPEGGPAIGGGPAGGGTLAAAPVGRVSGSPAVARYRAPRSGTVLALARVETWLLLRSLLVLAGLLVGGLAVWVLIHSTQPLWWNVAWQIGYGQGVLGMTVLIAAQLAAGRARRDGLADLYASLPATASTRTLGQLAGLAGALPASFALIGGIAVVVALLGPIGVPGVAPLAAGVLLVIAAGAAGIAIGTRFPHSLAGVLAGLALFVPLVESNNINGAGSWLLPWHQPGQLADLPGPLTGYPPAAAHAAELAAIAVLAAIVALFVISGGRRARGVLAIAALLAVAATCLAGAAQLRPVPTTALNHLVSAVAHPATVQHCSTADQVRYCLYPGFGTDLRSLEAPVSGVLAHLPARPGQPLTVQQAANPYLPDSTLTHGHPQAQVSRWEAQLQQAPGTAASASAIYLPTGSWPAAAGQLADAHFDLALATAEWAVGLAPTVSSRSLDSGEFQSCVPLGQAREAIAIWLAIAATHPSAGELQGGLGPSFAVVRNAAIPAWAYPGSSIGGYLWPQQASPQTTAAGYLLARAMTGLPERKVARVLAGAWDTWLNWHTTAAQLAAALGLPMPRVAALPNSLPVPPPGVTAPPQNPLCTT